MALSLFLSVSGSRTCLTQCHSVARHQTRRFLAESTPKEDTSLRTARRVQICAQNFCSIPNQKPRERSSFSHKDTETAIEPKSTDNSTATAHNRSSHGSNASVSRSMTRSHDLCHLFSSHACTHNKTSNAPVDGNGLSGSQNGGDNVENGVVLGGGSGHF